MQLVEETALIVVTLSRLSLFPSPFLARNMQLYFTAFLCLTLLWHLFRKKSIWLLPLSSSSDLHRPSFRLLVRISDTRKYQEGEKRRFNKENVERKEIVKRNEELKIDFSCLFLISIFLFPKKKRFSSSFLTHLEPKERGQRILHEYIFYSSQDEGRKWCVGVERRKTEAKKCGIWASKEYGVKLTFSRSTSSAGLFHETLNPSAAKQKHAFLQGLSQFRNVQLCLCLLFH